MNPSLAIRASGGIRQIAIWQYTGVSTAFAAPIGGLLLAIEEGSSFLNLGIFWRGFLATCSGVLTLHFLAQLHEDHEGILEAKLGIRRDLGSGLPPPPPPPPHVTACQD